MAMFEVTYTDGTTRTITNVGTKQDAESVSKELEPKLNIESIVEEIEVDLFG